MDEEILKGFNPGADENLKRQAFAYLESVKNSEHGWDTCLSQLTGNANIGSHLRFVYFQVIEHFIKRRYENADMNTKHKVRNFVMIWIRNQCTPGQMETAPYVIKKAVQVFTLIFVKDFPSFWNNFFFDLESTFVHGPQAVDIYLRILDDINTEVVDPDILRTVQEALRNSSIKNSMRENSVNKIVETLYHILDVYAATHPELIAKCLSVIGIYISWIDISFFANDRFVNILTTFMLKTETREAAVECLCGIVNKGMEPMDKLHLIETYIPVLHNRGVLNPIEDDQTDFTWKLAILVNYVGLNLTDAFYKVLKSDGTRDQLEPILSAIESKISFSLSFFGNNAANVSIAVHEFSKSYINMLKYAASLNEQQKNNIHELLVIIIKKLKYTESYNFLKEGEEEADFQEHRKQLKNMYMNLMALSKEIILNYITNVVIKTLEQWPTRPFQDVEMAIYLLYITGEALLAGGGNWQSREKNKLSEMESMLNVLVTCGVNNYPHPIVAVQYLETVVRYDKFFTLHPEHLPNTLMTFLSQCGFRNKSHKVRSRCSFLFVRFIKSLRCHLQTFAKDLLPPIRELLTTAEPNEDNTDQWLTFDDQLYLYEAVGVLVISATSSSQEKSQKFQEILVSLMNQFNACLDKLLVEEDPRKQAEYAQFLCHLMAVCSKLSKAFSQQQSIKSCGCVQIFIECLKVFLSSLQTPNQLALLQAGVRQFLHRMVVCLEDSLLPYIPEASQGLLRYSDIHSIQEYIPLIIQIISKYKKDIVPFLQQAFIPIVSAISAFLSLPLEENDEVGKRDAQMLQRQYFQFIAAIVNINVIDVLNAQDIQTQEQVIISIVKGAVDFPDPVSQRICFSILKRLVDMWGGNDATSNFIQFIYKNVVPACFMAPLKSTFDLTDAQTQVALSECAMCLKIIFNKQGENFLVYLHDEYLPTLNISSEQTDEICEMLKCDTHIFKQYIKAFFKKMQP